MIKEKLLMIFVFCLFFLAGCGGVNCLKQEIFFNNLKFKKNQTLNYVDVQEKTTFKYSSSSETEGLFKKSNEFVKIVHVASMPNSKFQCFDTTGKLLWEYIPERFPGDYFANPIIYAGEKESYVLILGRINYLYYIIFLDENGRFKKKIKLEILNKNHFHFMTFLLFNDDYIIAEYDKDVGIYDLNGNLIKHLMTRLSIKEITCLNFTVIGKNYLAILINHSRYSSTKNATIFILSDKWDLMYEEILTEGEWIGKQKGPNGDDLLVLTWDLKDCKLTGRRTLWKYTFE